MFGWLKAFFDRKTSFLKIRKMTSLVGLWKTSLVIQTNKR